MGRTNTLLEHKNLLAIIRDEFDEEISRLKIQPSSYKNSRNKEQPMFVLTISQAKQVLVRESKFVRKAIVKHLEVLEQKLNSAQLQPQLPQNYIEALKALVVSEEEKVVLQKQIKNNEVKIQFIDRVTQSVPALHAVWD